MHPAYVSIEAVEGWEAVHAHWLSPDEQVRQRIADEVHESRGSSSTRRVEQAVCPGRDGPPAGADIQAELVDAEEGAAPATGGAEQIEHVVAVDVSCGAIEEVTDAQRGRRRRREPGRSAKLEQRRVARVPVDENVGPAVVIEVSGQPAERPSRDAKAARCGHVLSGDRLTERADLGDVRE